MIGEGWSHEELMRMPARDFGFWLEKQEAHAVARAEAVRNARNGNRS